MPTTDARIDAYIAKSAEFARPILTHLRSVVHAGCPDAEETLKWGMPHFMHGGRNVAHMAAFKGHCAFGFWQGDVVAETGKNQSAMGQFGRIASLKDLPSKTELVRLVRKAVALIDSGEPPKRVTKAAPKPPLEPPPDLLAALRRNTAARKTFEAFSPSHQREYVEWLVEAKRPETREKRLAQAIAWMEEGKARHWKYQR